MREIRKCSVSTRMLQMEARKLKNELRSQSEFIASKNWIDLFLKRNNLARRRRTTICQRLPQYYEEKLFKF